MAAGTQKSSLIARRQYWGLVFVLPTVIFFIVFFLYPIISGIYYSLTDFTLLKPPVWVGLQNYQDLLKDRLFIKSISVTLGYVAGTTIPAWILSLFAAVVFFQKFRGREILKVLFFSPVLPSLIVVAIVWRILLQPGGILTTVLRPLTGSAEINWLDNPTLSPISMIIITNWTIIPFYMLIWLSGLTAIPEELRDAARVDGATRVQSFFRVELPLLRPTGVFIAAISTINAFQGFTLQYAISPGKGGPIDVNTTLGLLIWKYGFQYYRMGDASAVSMVLFAMIMIVVLIQLWLSRSDQFSLN
ncbi:MAG: sugar ABC transporter permease [Anaerolineae bacterium]|nr:sugar ABC transporter permease [Anaerolineae bacterium]MBN8618156.1 sugar ABC transporter permease [Anaerolineae bacterium]